MRRQLFLYSACFLAALLAAALLPWVGFVLLTAILLCALLFVFWRRRAELWARKGITAVAGVLTAAVVFGAFQLRYQLLYKPYENETAVVQAVVRESATSYTEECIAATLDVQAINGQAVRLRIYCAALPVCSVGEEISGLFVLQPLSDDAYRLNRLADGVQMVAEYQDRFSVLRESHDMRSTLFRLQTTLSRNIRLELPQEEGDVLAAMLLGDKAHLSQQTKAIFRKSGLSHLLVVSGLHLSLLTGLIPTSRRKVKRRRLHAVFTMLFAVFFSALTGFSPSVARAMVSVLVLGAGELLLEPADAVTSLGIAGLAMSLFNCYAICDIGFELSFASTLGIHLALERFHGILENVPQRLQGLASGLLVTAAALLFTFPVLVLQGMNVSLLALLAAVPAGALSEPILLFGLAFSVFGLVPALYPFAKGLLFVSGVMTKLLLLWAGCIAALPFGVYRIDRAYALSVGAALLLALFLLRLGRVGKGPTVVVLAGILVAAIALNAALSQNEIKTVMLGNKQNPSVIVLQQGKAAVLFRGTASVQKEISDYLEQEGIASAQVVFDLRQTVAYDCRIAAERYVEMAALPNGEIRSAAFGSVRITACRQKAGSLAVIYASDYRLAVSSGSIQLSSPMAVDWYLGSDTVPQALHPVGLLTMQAAAQAEDAVNVYSGENPILVFRPRLGVWIKGAVECR